MRSIHVDHVTLSDVGKGLVALDNEYEKLLFEIDARILVERRAKDERLRLEQQLRTIEEAKDKMIRGIQYAQWNRLGTLQVEGA